MPNICRKEKNAANGLAKGFLSNEYSLPNKVNYKYAANCTGSKLSQCSAIIFLMRMSHRIRQYQLKKNLQEIFAVDVGNYSNK